MRQIFSVVLILFLAIPFAAQSEENLIGEAFVNSVDVDYSEEGIILNIAGDVGDACTQIGEISQSIEEDKIIAITVPTSRPADLMCAQVITPFETSYTFDTSELSIGSYTLLVNGFQSSVVISPTDCPEVQSETYLYDAQGICFLFPENYTENSGADFVLISQPRSNNPLIIIEILPAKSLEEIASNFDNPLYNLVETRLGAQDSLMVSYSQMDILQAYVEFEDSLYVFTLQPSGEDSDELWELFTHSLFFNVESLENN